MASGEEKRRTIKLLNIDAQVHPTARKDASGFQEKKTQKENTKMHQFAQFKLISQF